MHQHLSCPNSTHLVAVAMCNYQHTRLPGRHYRLRPEERKKKAGLHVSVVSPPQEPCHSIRTTLANERYSYSKSVGSPAGVWWLQSGRVGLFHHMLCPFPSLVLEASEIRHTVSFRFTSHHHDLARRPCDRVLPHDDDVSMSMPMQFNQDMTLGNPPD